MLVVTGDGVNVRFGPSADARVKMRVYHDQQVMELQREGEWVRAEIAGSGGQDGWIHGSLLAAPGGDEVAAPRAAASQPEAAQSPVPSPAAEPRGRGAGDPGRARTDPRARSRRGSSGRFPERRARRPTGNCRAGGDRAGGGSGAAGRGSGRPRALSPERRLPQQPRGRGRRGRSVHHGRAGRRRRGPGRCDRRLVDDPARRPAELRQHAARSLGRGARRRRAGQRPDRRPGRRGAAGAHPALTAARPRRGSGALRSLRSPAARLPASPARTYRSATCGVSAPGFARVSDRLSLTKAARS